MDDEYEIRVLPARFVVNGEEVDDLTDKVDHRYSVATSLPPSPELSRVLHLAFEAGVNVTPSLVRVADRPTPQSFPVIRFVGRVG